MRSIPMVININNVDYTVLHVFTLGKRDALPLTLV